MIDWCHSLIWSLQVVMASNASWEEEIRRRALYNGGKMVLQDALNTIFGLTPNEIIVETQSEVAYKTFTYNESENIPIYSYNESESSPPIYLFNDSEAVDDFDFLVLVPVGIYTAELDRRIRAEVNLYKTAGKSFDVITY